MLLDALLPIIAHFLLLIAVLSTLEKVNSWEFLMCAVNKCASLWHLLNIVPTFLRFDFNFSTVCKLYDYKI